MNEYLQDRDVNEPAPLTDWVNPPKLRDLKQHLEDARSIHSAHVSQVDQWLDNRNITGNARIKTPEGNSKVQPKLIRKQAEWRYPALSEPFLSTSDVFNVSPVSWEDREGAQQNEMLLNHQFNTKMNKVAFIDEYVRTAVDEGTVIVKLSWAFQEEEYTANEPIVEFHFDQSFAPAIQQALQMQQESPSQYDTDIPEELKQAVSVSQEKGFPYRPVIRGYNQVQRMRTVKNHPTVEVCDYRNVILDPTARGDMSKANFIIFSFESSLSDLKKDGRYKNLDQINVQNNSPLSQPDHASDIALSNFNLNDKPRTKFVVYEYWGSWDTDGTGIVKPIVAAWVGEVMIRMEDNPFPDKELPFVVVPYLPIRRSNYGEPDGALLEDNQKIIGALSRGMIDVMAKSANGQTGTVKGYLDAVNKRKFENGEDYEFNPSQNPDAAVYMHKFSEIPQSAPLLLQMHNQEAESLTGVKSFTNGVTGNSLGDVAAGVRGALDAASKRETAILRRLAKGMVDIGRKIIAMNAVFLSEEEVVRVTNEQFVKIRRDDLAGNYDLKLSISTAEEDDNKARELAFMLQTMGNNMDPMMSKMILSDIARLRKMPDLAHRIETYEPQPDPLQVKKAELEVALLEAQVETERASAAKEWAMAGLQGQKTNTEAVKQGHLKADTDLKNLNFVEQESGTTQEREIEKNREKARDQANVEVIKHGLTPQNSSKSK